MKINISGIVAIGLLLIVVAPVFAAQNSVALSLNYSAKSVRPFVLSSVSLSDHALTNQSMRPSGYRLDVTNNLTLLYTTRLSPAAPSFTIYLPYYQEASDIRIYNATVGKLLLDVPLSQINRDNGLAFAAAILVIIVIAAAAGFYMSRKSRTKLELRNLYKR